MSDKVDTFAQVIEAASYMATAKDVYAYTDYYCGDVALFVELESEAACAAFFQELPSLKTADGYTMIISRQDDTRFSAVFFAGGMKSEELV